ncbi:MBL fold metallo-hydrolase [Legionella spiritensis]|uniref:Metal-dependent hydrolase of the beta-lactamase superfamily transporter III n=1 Tax=Legionella spiritensis TaxID=452 RepID=A0A0W0ZBQ8_LEGSP|nr:MBL fold metallo-hydrolase [Legionella spiritensis]KTD66307.1 metal-dependent hydrolase of the beta-lactamase superfamily transporter III [Legionella spiritensis]SNV48578.1 metal-dependent hydrolase of the beta-lactamase superfamily transporter III [Legionella spiritensis]
MKLLFLGSASGLSESVGNFQSNMVLMADSGKKLLIDCGTDIRFSLSAAKLCPDDIDAIYISHLHADHAGGLEWLGFNRKFKSQKSKPSLIIHHTLADPLWQHCLSGGMDTLKNEKATLASFFDVHALADGQEFAWEGAVLELVQTIHAFSDGHLIPSYGLLIRIKERQYFITADTQFNEHLLMPYYVESQLIFHDCETSDVPSGVHAHYEQLKSLSPAIKAKMWLYHYSDDKLPDAGKHGFCGFVKPRQLIDLE